MYIILFKYRIQIKNIEVLNDKLLLKYENASRYF